jgi:hypothetical protein
MSRARALAALALTAMAILGAPAAAQGVVPAPAASPYDPVILWHEPATRPIGSQGRVRFIPYGDGAVMLSLNQYWTWRGVYEEELARLSFRMPVRRAQPAAAREATSRFLAAARAQGVRLSGFRGYAASLDWTTPGPDYLATPAGGVLVPPAGN